MNLANDLRYALRQLRSSPAFAITAVLSIALGIGATTAVFSVVHAVLLDPYPYRDSDRMVHVELRHPDNREWGLLMVNGSQYKDVLSAHAVEDAFLMRDENATMTSGTVPVTVDLGSYSPNVFTFMGVPPQLGRQFTQADAAGNHASPVAVLSYLFWKRQFGASKDVVGKTITLNGTLYTIIGVAAPRFTWGDSDVYTPAIPTADPQELWQVFVRLKPGVTRAQAAAEFGALLPRFLEQAPKDIPRDLHVAVVTLNEEVLHGFAGPLYLLFASVLLLLLIGCANVSILLLAKGTAREHEFAVRSALGASRARVIRQLLTESFALSLVGGGLGVLAAYFGVEALAGAMPFYSFPHEASIHVSGAVLLFTLVVALLTTLLFGLSPALQLSRSAVGQMIQSSNTRQSGSRTSRRTHRLLIGGQVALTMLLLASAGAAIQGFLVLYRTPLGIDPHNIEMMDVALPKETHPTWQGRVNLQEAVRAAVAGTPGVESAAVSTTWMPPFQAFTAKVEVEGKPDLGGAQSELSLVSPQVFGTLRIPLLAGRVFNDAERARAAHLAVVNQAFVRRYLPNTNPIGQHVRSAALKLDRAILLLGPEPDGWLEIIGVAADARNDGLERPVQPAVFLPDSFVIAPDVSLLVRTRPDPETTMPAIKKQLSHLNGELVVGRAHTLGWFLESRAWGRQRFVAELFVIFAALALVLAATGLYSVVSYIVGQRTREIGVRMALGAQRWDVVRTVMQGIVYTVGAGLGAGFVLCVALNRTLLQVVESSSSNPLTLVGGAGVLLAAAVLACILPARRAASIQPMQALRNE
ncbi:MAG: ABC transporter permease [Acidobacteriaceae bacterium]